MNALPAATPAEILARLRPRIIETSPGSQRKLHWSQLRTSLPIAAAVAGFAILFFVIQTYVIAPMSSRRLVAQATDALIAIRQGTGRVPLRYIPGFQRARVTRSGFDVADPEEEAIEAEIEARFQRAVALAPHEVTAKLALGLSCSTRGGWQKPRQSCEKLGGLHRTRSPSSTGTTRVKKTPTVITQAVAAPGTAEALAATPTEVVYLQLIAKKVGGSNAGSVFIGSSTVDRTTEQQVELLPGQPYEFRAMDGVKLDLNELFVDAANAGDGVTGFFLLA